VTRRSLDAPLGIDILGNRRDVTCFPGVREVALGLSAQAMAAALKDTDRLRHGSFSM
jgi:hypothetical protein